MPYYCTVPRCTSMAGKAKNVSFHQFPRDEELAHLWNKILKRGKPFTKYSKVCSLHFRPEDYTITSVGKNKGQWRTLRKDAIPSRNLPSESPGPTVHRTRSSGSWVPALPPNVIDTQVQQQMAQAIYMQTMLAMQAATNGTPLPVQSSVDSAIANTSTPPLSEIERLLQSHTQRNGTSIETNEEDKEEDQDTHNMKQLSQTSYKCEECSKCFKDPDVFVLHQRTHTKRSDQERIPDKLSVVEKENLNANYGNQQETLRANPILANLLKSGMPNEMQDQLPNNFNTLFDLNNVLSIENQIMTALAANMENYIRNLSSMLNQTPNGRNDSDNADEENHNDSEENSNLNENNHTYDENNHADDENNHADDENNHTNDENNHTNDENNHTNEHIYTNDENNHTNDENIHTNDENNHTNDENNHTNDENIHTNDENNHTNDENNHTSDENFGEESQNIQQENDFTEQDSMIKEECNNINEGSAEEIISEPNCDNEDLNESKDSSSLVIDEEM